MGKYFLPIFLIIVFLIPTPKLTAGLTALYSLQENISGQAGDDPAVKSEQSDTTDVLTALTARIKDQSIFINWRLSNPTEISYFEVQRLNSKTRAYEKINENRIKKSDFTEKAVDENNFRIFKYNFEDKPEKDGVYYYKLVGFTSNGTVLFESDEIKIGISGIRDFTLEQNHPNPFNPTTTIKYELNTRSHVTLKVFDLIGREVATLVDQIQNEGTYSVEFDASKFSQLTSGIYFYKLQTDNYSDVKKMILSK
jgi:hypothetical protein